MTVLPVCDKSHTNKAVTSHTHSKHDLYKIFFNFLKKGADKRDVIAQYWLACMYLELEDYKNLDEAIKYLALPVENEYPGALYHLGNMYYLGNEKVEKNLNKAFDLISKAAEKGDRNAQNLLSTMCLL